MNWLGCPNGYSNRIGDITGYALTGAYGASMEKCKIDCDKRKDCGSFVHSELKNECKLTLEYEPTGPKFNDFVFCSRNHLSGYNLYITYYVNIIAIKLITWKYILL